MHGLLYKPLGGTAGLSSSVFPEKFASHCWTSQQCHPPCHSMRRSGFTLIELLITVTIIGILAAGVLAALQGARETAKIAKTKSTITKLHYIIMARYDSYRTRRVPVDVRKYVTSHDGDNTTGSPADEGVALYPYNDPTIGDSIKLAHVRLMALRDLMRTEMPDRWSDVETPLLILTNQPSISSRYARLLFNAGGSATAFEHAAAECLYMIVMSIPEAAEQFQNTEIGDVDGDGLKEFVDGWGNPIRFIRWPVGFVDFANLLDSDGPAGSTGDSSATPPIPEGPQLEWDSPSDLQSGNRQEQPDPFDSMRVTYGFAVFPLIYSAGSDGIYDINIGSLPYTTLLYHQNDGNIGDDAESPPNTFRYIGQPLDAPSIDGTPKNGELNHYDNIHNHRLEVR